MPQPTHMMRRLQSVGDLPVGNALCASPADLVPDAHESCSKSFKSKREFFFPSPAKRDGKNQAPKGYNQKKQVTAMLKPRCWELGPGTWLSA